MYLCLLTNTLAGGGYLLLLLFLCAGGTIGCKALRRSLRERSRERERADRAAKEAQAPPEEDKRPAKKREPQKIYYIVEKKRSRPRQKEYGEPKRIKFGD